MRRASRPRIFQHRRIDQLVIDDDVGLAQRTGRAQGQQLRVAWAGADQRYAPGLDLGLAAIDGSDEVARGALLVAGEDGGGNRAAQHLVPEAAARGILADTRLDGSAEALRELRQTAEPGRQHASIAARTRCASTGDAPWVETATTMSPRSTIAGMVKSLSSGRSTMLTSLPAARARSATMRSSASLPVAPNTSSAAASCDIENASRTSWARVSATAASRSAEGVLAMAVTRAPAEPSSRSLAAAALPAPTSRTGRPSSFRNSGKLRI
jgi:hypothetical protein